MRYRSRRAAALFLALTFLPGCGLAQSRQVVYPNGASRGAAVRSARRAPARPPVLNLRVAEPEKRLPAMLDD